MKKVRMFLPMLAFVFAVGAALAPSTNAATEVSHLGYEPGCSVSQDCGNTGSNTCIINSVTLYQNTGTCSTTVQTRE